MRRRLPEPSHPASAEREYHRYLRKYAQTYALLMSKGLKEILPDMREVAALEQPRMDENIEAKLKRLFGWVEKNLARIFPDPMLRGWALAMISKVSRNSKSNTNRTMKAVYKEAGEPAPDFEPFMHDRKLTPYYQNVVDENVGLIRSIPLEKLPVFKNQLVAMITADAPSSQIQEAIMKNFAVTRNKAALIARDQIGKVNGALEEHRQKQLGFTRYRWRTSEDSRVRKDHKELDGQIFDWSKPPIVDKRTGRRAHPKRDFQCRCWAEPIIEDVIET